MATMTLDLSGGLTPDHELFFPSRPEDPEMRESTSIWLVRIDRAQHRRRDGQVDFFSRSPVSRQRPLSLRAARYFAQTFSWPFSRVTSVASHAWHLKCLRSIGPTRSTATSHIGTLHSAQRGWVGAPSVARINSDASSRIDMVRTPDTTMCL